MAELPYGQRILAWTGEPPDPERFVALGGVRLPSVPDPIALGQALNAAVARHPVLGTGPVPLAVVEDVWAAAAAGRYPPDAPCLLWAYLAGRDLLLVAHHNVADPWSMRLLTREVRAPRTGPAPSYRDEIEPVPAARLARAVPYWRDVLAGVSAEPARDGGPAELRMTTGITVNGAAANARRLRSTPFVALLAAFTQALPPVGERVLPVLTYGRQRREWDTVGLYMNVLPVRVAASDLAAVHRSFAEAYAHEIPFPVLLDTVPDADRVFRAGGPALPQFEVIQLPEAHQCEPLTVPAGLGLGGPVLPVNGPVFWLEPGEAGRYTACLRYRDPYGEAEAADLIRRFIERWEAICADARRT